MKRIIVLIFHFSFFTFHSASSLAQRTEQREPSSSLEWPSRDERRRSQRTWGQWDSWGEQPDGTYMNPILPADYSDLDCIRVGDDYYAITSTMQYSPGMTILHSRDLVNWEIVGNAVSDLTQISPALGWQQMDRYGRGIWAGSLRYHNGRFYLYFGTPDEGLFMTSASRAEGPWEPLTPLLRERGWDDCSAIWDAQGNGWFVATCFAEGYKTYLFRMAKDGRSIDGTTRRLVNEGYGREANKLIRHGKYYYLVFSEHRDGIGRYVMSKRDKKMTGLFKEEKQLLHPCLEAHEPNQGGIIEGPNGKWYFLTHHGNGDWSGRIMSLLPVTWREDWPLMGDLSQGTPGSMVWHAKMPIVIKNEALGPQGRLRSREEQELRIKNENINARQLQSEDFESESLGPQWQWNYQPRADKFSLTEHPGWLRLYAFLPLETDRFLKVGNTLTQRSFRLPRNEVTVKLDLTHLADGCHAGLCHFAEHNGCLGVVCEGGQVCLEQRIDDCSQRGLQIQGEYLWIRSSWGLDGLSHFAYSLDGEHFISFGEYVLSWGFYRGDRIGIYCYNNLAEKGYVDIDFFRYSIQ